MPWMIDTPRRFDPDEFIDEDIRCPPCGCRDVIVTRYPRLRSAGGWYAHMGAGGRAECQHCDAVFSIRLMIE